MGGGTSVFRAVQHRQAAVSRLYIWGGVSSHSLKALFCCFAFDTTVRIFPQSEIREVMWDLMTYGVVFP